MSWLDDLFRLRGLATVTIADTASPTVASDAAAASLVIVASGTVTATRTLRMPHKAGAIWIIENATGYDLSVGGQTGAAVTVAAGDRTLVYSTGSAFKALSGSGSSSIDAQEAAVAGPGVASLTVAQSQADYLSLTGAPGEDVGVAWHASATREVGTRFVVRNATDSAQTLCDPAGSDFMSLGALASAELVWITSSVLGVVARSDTFTPAGLVSQVMLGNGAASSTVPAAALPALNIVGTYAARPAAGVANRIFVATDTGIAYHDDGTAWRPMIAGVLGTAPPATTATIIPAATTYAEAAIAGSHVQRFSTTDTATNHLGAWFKGTVSGSSWSVEAAFALDAFTGTEPTSLAGGSSSVTNAGVGAYPGFAIVVDNGGFAASGGAGSNLFAFTTVFSVTGGNFGWNMGSWQNAVSRSAWQDLTSFWPYRGELLRMRVRYDSSKYYCDINHDGICGWREIGQVAASTLTGPARYGVALQPWGGALAANLYSLTKT